MMVKARPGSWRGEQRTGTLSYTSMRPQRAISDMSPHTPRACHCAITCRVFLALGLIAVLLTMPVAEASGGYVPAFARFNETLYLRGYSPNCAIGASLGIRRGPKDATVVVLDVLPKGPAERGDLRAGDQLIAVDGHPVDSGLFSLRKLYGACGTPVELTVARGDGYRTLSILREGLSTDDAIRATREELTKAGVPPVDILVRAECLANYLAQGREIVPALELYGDIIKSLDASPEKNDVAIALILTKICVLHIAKIRAEHREDEGDALSYDRLVEILKSHKPSRDSEADKGLFNCVENLAVEFSDFARRDRSIELYKIAQGYAPVVLSDSQLNLSWLTEKLGADYWKEGKRDEALKHYERSYGIAEDWYGTSQAKSDRCRNSLHILGDTYEKLGQYDKVEALYRSAISAREARFGKTSPEIYTPLIYLLGFYKGRGRIDDVIQCYEREIALDRFNLDLKRGPQMQLYKSYIDYLETHGRKKEAERVYAKRREAQLEHAIKVTE